MRDVPNGSEEVGAPRPRVSRLLAVDDDESQRQLVAAIFKKSPAIEVVGVCDGDSALASVSRDAPDIVLVDLCMPGIGGLESTTLDFASAKRQLAGHLALVLEDDIGSFGRMFVSLSSAGCLATLARRWAQVDPTARRIAPTLILFSTRLAEVGGAEIVRRLREDPSTRNAILIAIAGHESRRERHSLLALGCDGYVWKPTDRYLFAMDLVARTPRLLEGQRPARMATLE